MKILKMIRKVVLFTVLVFISTLTLTAQKVKYKDLIVLLSARDFEKAEPFLKRYLKENTENPNAFLYMGIIYQDKTSRLDPLTRTDYLAATLDSALLFYDKAYKTIDERELKKNDEYYEAYTRRDLRTGKFVIKMSDVRLDIETRTADCKSKKSNVKLLRAHLTAAANAYGKSTAVYKALVDKYGSERDFFLRSDEAMVEQIKALTTVFDSVGIAFTQYKAVSKVLGKTAYNQVIDLQPIKDMKRDGSGEVDFLKDDLKLWDYKSWSTQSQEIIQNEINPMREHLVFYDIEINKLREKLKADSVSVKSDLTKLVTRIFADQLKKYDADPMPLNVFEMKMAELEYASNLIVNKHLRDSTSVSLRLKAIKTEISDLRKMDSMAVRLTKRNFEEESKDYSHFITKAYGTIEVLKSLISSTADFAQREKLKREKEWERVSQSLKWLIAGSDSIPIFTESNRELRFKPLVIEQEKFTFGLAYQDSLATGYFYGITPSRIPDIKATFPVDQKSFYKSRLPLLKGISASDEAGHVYFAIICSTAKKAEKFPVTIAKIYRSDGLAWSNNFQLDALPVEAVFSNETGNLSIKLLLADGSNKIVMVDKAGKQVP